MFRIFKTTEFDTDFSKLDGSEQIRVEKILNQLSEHGREIGKPLAGLNFFREKKFGGKRLYYLMYENFLIVLVVAISNKKAQQATINKIIFDLQKYQKFVLETLRKKGII